MDAKALPVPNLGAKAAFKAAAPSPPAASKKSGGKKDGGENLRDYFRCMAGVDDNIGRLMKGLDEDGLANHTLVIFVSDNGYYLGEHGLGDKRSAYEESMRIPLLLRHPALIPKGTVHDAMALHIDLAPTIIEAAGLTPPGGMQGQSLLPVLSGKEKNLRSSFLYFYQQENAYPATPTTLGVRTETAKLITYPEHPEWDEVFQLSEDPYETRNRIADPACAGLVKDLRAELKNLQETMHFKGMTVKKSKG
jgi:arylsulfatase A-like enzyme